jgi:uncharacterized membrane protein YphA (DoxX/SURF4 family)
MTRRNILSLLLRISLGSLMAVAGISKLLDTGAFIAAIRQFGILPPWMIFPAMIVVLQSEIWLGLALAAGFRTRIVAVCLGGLIAVFIAAIAIALSHGVNGDCGCFGIIGAEKIGGGLMVRDFILLLGCFWLAFQDQHRATDTSKSDRDKTVEYS